MPTRRLGSRRFRTAIIRPPAGTDWRARLAAADAELAADYREARAPSAWRAVRATRRILLMALWTLLCIPIQAACLAIGGRPPVVFARWYHAVLCRIGGIRVRMIGTPATPQPGRPVLFLCNHQSWADVLVLGGRLEACFIAKAEIGSWPLIRTVARLGRTVYVSRRRGATAREKDELVSRLAKGDSLILFPEGTTSDGARILPFRSALVGAVEAAGIDPIVQPVSLVFDKLDGLPVTRPHRPHFSWYGDMDIASHAWTLLGRRSCRATILLHEPLDPAAFPNRKALAEAAYQAVDEGAAALRQGREARPLSPKHHAPAAASSPDRA
ncbi:lysophospholipid acyltransferase family protein [Elioraea tepidiphila]|jgi:1-acyl-sn-glycerol-3-phosphate acyltransferase|uniref:lysophospholipid acyltransferase family protein n=1 Tax=Elioraea tepidiphila TaxID=457934 RepID=UPI000373DFAB|nr:lysophospholipid acyltransferase family protein [Elioraea tepidiphila]